MKYLSSICSTCHFSSLLQVIALKKNIFPRLGNTYIIKVKGNYWPYVKWSLLFLLLHNVCFHLHIYSDQYGWKEHVSHLYAFSEFLSRATSIIFKMHGHEQLLGGYWFMNALFFGSLIVWPVIRYVKQPLCGGVF